MSQRGKATIRQHRAPDGRRPAFWYGQAGVTYIGFSVFHKFLLNWFIGPLWLVTVVWLAATPHRCRAAGRREASMSWAAHQFEIYAVQAHLPKKMKGKVSFFGIFLGDFTPDFLSKFWVYGITIGGTHYGASAPHRWHRGWPGMGFTHTCSSASSSAGCSGSGSGTGRFTVGYLLGYAAHALTDVNDSVGTMLLFPFSTLNWTVETWAYAATKDGGKYLDAAVLQQPRPRDGPVLAGRRALLLAGAHPRVLAHADRARRPAHLVVARAAAPARARPPRALPGHVLLRRVPPHRVVDHVWARLVIGR